MTTKRLIFWIIGIIIVAILLGALLALILGGTSPDQPTPGQPVTLPESGTTDIPLGKGLPSGPGTMTIADFEGRPIVTNDFINNGVTIPDGANKGRYLLAGQLGYCVEDPAPCRAGTETDFNIYYDSQDEAFTIALLAEPLGQTRLGIQTYLARTLGIGEQDMCRLEYYVGTPSDVNSFFTGKNLGFSFCPGATRLPE